MDELGRHVRINECIDLVNTLGQVAFSPVTQLRKISRNVQLLDIQLCVRRKTAIFFELNYERLVDKAVVTESVLDDLVVKVHHWLLDAQIIDILIAIEI